MNPPRIHKPDFTLITVVFIIIIFGLVMLSSASSVIGYQKFGDANYYLKHQIIYGIFLGLIGMYIASRIDYHWWKKVSFPFLVICVILLFLVLVPGIGSEYGGARRWVNIGGILFQPTELAKIIFLLYIATWLSKKKKEKEMNNFTYGFVPFLILLGIITFLVMMQPDLGTMTVIAFISVAVYFLAGANLRHLALIFLIGLVLFGLMIQIEPYRAARFSVFLNPELDPQGIGYHVNQALLAIGSGGIFGLGLGHSRQKYNYLPEVAGDSIYCVIAEELGLIISLMVLGLYLLVMNRGLIIARFAPDEFGRLIAGGITIWITFQAVVNIGSMISILPMTGITLPLISFGSSSIATVMTAIGILINVSKQTTKNS